MQSSSRMQDVRVVLCEQVRQKLAEQGRVAMHDKEGRAFSDMEELDQQGLSSEEARTHAAVTAGEHVPSHALAAR